MAVLWNQFKAYQVIKKIKQTNKQNNKKKEKENKQKKKKQKQKKTQKQKRARSTDLRLTALFFTLQQHPLSKWLWLKWQVAQSFHQARSHDLFWKGVGPPQKQWTFWTKTLFELTFLGP